MKHERRASETTMTGKLPHSIRHFLFSAFLLPPFPSVFSFP